MNTPKAKIPLKINFVLPPCPKISGGPLAILEYANRLMDKGHEVTVTTYSSLYWEGENPFPWFKFKGKILYKKADANLNRSFGNFLNLVKKFLNLAFLGITRKSPDRKARFFNEFAEILALFLHQTKIRKHVFGEIKGSRSIGLSWVMNELLSATSTLSVMPECDLNIATWWATTLPILGSGKGKPVYFMQHYEEVFYTSEYESLLPKLCARLSYELPFYKVANSQWLEKLIEEKFHQKVPFSTNGVELSDFGPRAKLSEQDQKIRILTYGRPESWKGLGDAAAIVAKLKSQTSRKIEWNVFGYFNPQFPPDNKLCQYKLHRGLSFKQLAELYATSDIALCPSWYESFPLPPLEAMASGTAVVTTAYGTEDYAFHGINALVYESRMIDEAVKHLKSLVEDEALRKRLASEGLKTAQKFSWDTAVENREKILLDIAADNISYDRFAPCDLEIRDGNGLLYKQAPAHVLFQDNTVVKCEETNIFFLLHERSKFFISSMAVVAEAEKVYGPVQSMDYEVLMQIPSSFSIDSIKDLPTK